MDSAVITTRTVSAGQGNLSAGGAIIARLATFRRFDGEPGRLGQSGIVVSARRLVPAPAVSQPRFTQVPWKFSGERKRGQCAHHARFTHVSRMRNAVLDANCLAHLERRARSARPVR